MTSAGFAAAKVGVEYLADLEVTIVGLAEHEDGGGRSLLFQWSDTFDDQDRRLGMDTYAVSNELGRTTYGGVRRLEFRNNRLRLLLERKAASDLGTARVLDIELRVEPAELHRFWSALNDLFLAAGEEKVVIGIVPRA
jgi:hypothetical protein